jgi:hypothetical protein
VRLETRTSARNATGGKLRISPITGGQIGSSPSRLAFHNPLIETTKATGDTNMPARMPSSIIASPKPPPTYVQPTNDASQQTALMTPRVRPERPSGHIQQRVSLLSVRSIAYRETQAAFSLRSSTSSCRRRLGVAASRRPAEVAGSRTRVYPRAHFGFAAGHTSCSISTRRGSSAARATRATSIRQKNATVGTAPGACG